MKKLNSIDDTVYCKCFTLVNVGTGFMYSCAELAKLDTTVYIHVLAGTQSCNTAYSFIAHKVGECASIFYFFNILLWTKCLRRREDNATQKMSIVFHRFVSTTDCMVQLSFN
jgi:hypothetical protein